MCETGRTGKSAYRTTRCLSRNPPGVPVLHVKVCYATCVAVSFSLSSCLDRISQQSHKSAPTADRSNLLRCIIGPYGWPDEFVNVHNRPPDHFVNVHYWALRFFTSVVSCGRMVRTSPTTPRSTTEKMGACSSLLMATMYLEPFIPARCWIAPLMPQAMYRVGFTVLPVCPTW